MSKLSRRAFIGSTALGAGALTLNSRTSAKSHAAGARSYPLERIERQNIKIIDLKMTPLTYIMDPSEYWSTADYECWRTDEILVEVFTDQGITGIGGSSQYGGPEEMLAYFNKVIRPMMIGKNPFDVELLATGPSYGRIGNEWFHKSCAWSGVDCALWDIIGKATGMPVYKLLATDNEPDPHVRIYASGGVDWKFYDHPETLIEEGLRYKEEGYTAFKFRKGTDWQFSNMDIKKYVTFLYQLREAVGPEMDLMHEAMGSTGTVDEIIDQFCPVLEELKFLWFEEPVRRSLDDQTVENHIRVNEALPTVMVSGGETKTNRFQFKEWLDRNAFDIAQPDCNNMGLTESWYVARMAHLHGKYCIPHNWHGGLTTMANAHLTAAIPNRLMCELNQTVNPLTTEVFVDPLVAVDGYMDLPDKPGFGMELAPDLEKRFPFIPGSAMSFRRQNPVMR
jgi:L-alanine-DL-glutamate epimerase-like enolase superfamily enzyme